MAGKGRPQKYKTHVEPHLAEIADMALTMTEEQIAKTLGVSYSAFRRYKEEYKELSDSIKKGRTELVRDLRSTLIKKAKGFSYEERKTIVEHGNVVREEIITKTSLPDVAAINLALKNYDADNWANDPQIMKLKREEFEFKKLNVEKLESW